MARRGTRVIAQRQVQFMFRTMQIIKQTLRIITPLAPVIAIKIRMPRGPYHAPLKRASSALPSGASGPMNNGLLDNGFDFYLIRFHPSIHVSTCDRHHQPDLPPLGDQTAMPTSHAPNAFPFATSQFPHQGHALRRLVGHRGGSRKPRALSVCNGMIRRNPKSLLPT